MAEIKTLLVDDEFLALNLLETFVQKIPEMVIVDKVKNPLKAIEILNREPVDLLFLDIQMPTLSGTEMLKTIQNPPVTIFTTAYADYAVEAFSLNAIDYLLKPFSFERFLQAVNKAKERIHFQRSASGILMPSQSRDFFTAKVDGKLVKIRFGDILFIEGLKEYVRIVCTDARHVTLESLKNLEQLLPQEAFIRVHKSFIVAKDKVQQLNGNMLEIGKHKIPISRTKKEEVVEWIFFT
ncbi:MAG: response regulator transcription factor [Saprospiraceae bacterium]|nr:response regulator transcription factor [Saprospiraceae bacterium]MCB9324649.1 response regulator transcription factor [Lewinellaceae bacterium]